MAGRLAGQLAVVPDGDVSRGAPGHLAGGEAGELGQRSLLRCGSEAEQGGSAFGEIGAGQRGTSLSGLGSLVVGAAACLRLGKQAGIHRLIERQLVR
jgi:hypothetical protein